VLLVRTRTKGRFMQDAPEERWKKLCELAANEQDPQKLLALVQEINDLLKGKQPRSSSAPPPQ
jgi:hypothetical protein